MQLRDWESLSLDELLSSTNRFSPEATLEKLVLAPLNAHSAEMIPPVESNEFPNDDENTTDYRCATLPETKNISKSKEHYSMPPIPQRVFSVLFFNMNYCRFHLILYQAYHSLK